MMTHVDCQRSSVLEEEAAEGDHWRDWLSKRRVARLLVAAHQTALCVALCAAGIVEPSLLSGPYFVAFLALTTLWAANKPISEVKRRS